MADRNGGPEQERVYTPEEFMVTVPLYTRVRTDGLYAPAKIEFECASCEKETTWDRTAGAEVLREYVDGKFNLPDRHAKFVAYKCHRCGAGPLLIIYRELEQGERAVPNRVGSGISRNLQPPPAPQTVVIAAMKIGQYPAPSVTVSKGVLKALTPELASFYRKALINRNYGNGIAAVAYLRRVVEDTTNDLIEIAAQEAEDTGTSEDTVSKMRSAISAGGYTSYKEKLKYAASVFPESLTVGGHNPLDVLFSNVSKGLHSLSEEECIQVADRIRVVFEYVFENLKAQVDKRRAYQQSFKGLL